MVIGVERGARQTGVLRPHQHGLLFLLGERRRLRRHHDRPHQRLPLVDLHLLCPMYDLEKMAKSDDFQTQQIAKQYSGYN
jgi:hypothetical protein